MRTRTEGYVGQVIDGEKLAKIANKIYKLQYNNLKAKELCSIDNLLFITLKEENVFGDNKYAVICTEGVGWEQDRYGCLEVPTNLGQMNGQWNGRVFISIDVIKECLSDKTQDISTYIRTFGDRLDSNCELWQSKMIKAECKAIA